MMLGSDIHLPMTCASKAKGGHLTDRPHTNAGSNRGALRCLPIPNPEIYTFIFLYPEVLTNPILLLR